MQVEPPEISPAVLPMLMLLPGVGNPKAEDDGGDDMDVAADDNDAQLEE